MTYEETNVLNFLGETPETWFSRREIARKAVHRREYEENPNWAVAPISALLLRGLIENNVSGNYKFKPRH